MRADYETNQPHSEGRAVIVRRKRGWYLASIGTLTVADKDRLAAINLVIKAFSAGLPSGCSV